MKARANLTINESFNFENNYTLKKTSCTICNKKYEKSIFINEISFGGSCINCEKKYIKIIGELKNKMYLRKK